MYYPTKKSLGQHWLHDDASLRAMCDGIDLAADDIVLEIGPGLGTLTTKLLAKAQKVIAVEFDADLARDLVKNIGDVPSKDRLEVIQADILKFNLTTLPARYKVAANIPYYLTSNILRLLCESSNPFSQASLLMQKEVAERVCAGPGDMSMLSVSVQFYCQASLGVVVPARLFTPPPKVDSQVLLLTHRAQPLFADVNPKQFFRVVKAGFAQRRKTLLNSLAAGLRVDRATVENILLDAGVVPLWRAQNLSLDDWYRVYQAVQHYTNDQT